MPCTFTVLHSKQPSYEHLRVFGCLCYPYESITAPHKLAPRSSRYVFLGHSSNHEGYCYLHLSNNHIVISQHIVFNEAVFVFATSPPPTNGYDFLFELAPIIPLINVCLPCVGLPAPRVATSPSPTPAVTQATPVASPVTMTSHVSKTLNHFH
jgi:hypothetical protein